MLFVFLYMLQKHPDTQNAPWEMLRSGPITLWIWAVLHGLLYPWQLVQSTTN